MCVVESRNCTSSSPVIFFKNPRTCFSLMKLKLLRNKIFYCRPTLHSTVVVTANAKCKESSKSCADAEQEEKKVKFGEFVYYFKITKQGSQILSTSLIDSCSKSQYKMRMVLQYTLRWAWDETRLPLQLPLNDVVGDCINFVMSAMVAKKKEVKPSQRERRES